MEGYYYGILRKYTEELKRPPLLKEQSIGHASANTNTTTNTNTNTNTNTTTTATATATTTGSQKYHQTTPLVCNQTNSVTSNNVR